MTRWPICAVRKVIYHALRDLMTELKVQEYFKLYRKYTKLSTHPYLPDKENLNNKRKSHTQKKSTKPNILL